MTRLVSHRRAVTHRVELIGLTVGLAVVVLVVAALAGTFGDVSAETRGAVVVGVALFVPTFLLARALARHDDDPGLLSLLVAAFVAKFGGALLRFQVLYGTYEGLGDAGRYFAVGTRLAGQFASGDFFFGDMSGTRFMEVLTGLAYVVLPDSELAGFIFFAWLSFLGLILFSRAIRKALPDADHRRYDLLLFFLPTLVFWPSSIGKDAWMMLMLGAISYGAAQLLTNRSGGLVPIGLGAWGAMVMRPHVALIALASLAPAWVVRPSGRNRLGLSPVTRAIGLVMVLVVMAIIIGQAERFFGIESLAEGADEVAFVTETQTGTGGSDFDNVRVTQPILFPVATVTVLFRPFVWETDSITQLITALEGVFLLLLVASSWRQIVRLPTVALRQAYVLYALTFTMIFIVAYSAIANFGILARQRAQLYPFFLVLLIPLGHHAVDEDRLKNQVSEK